PSPLAILAATLITGDLLIALRAGSHVSGDARYHAARVRMLLTHGFNNWDPLVPGHRFDLVYHSNLYHALIADGAKLSGLDGPAGWAFALFFAKLAACSAAYHLT